MYIEAVADILRRLAAPRIKSSVKTDLTSQLQQIDPMGEIKKYVLEGGPRPNMDHIRQFAK